MKENSVIFGDERFAHLVRLCARGFNRSLALRLSEHDVSFGQWVFLRILWKEEGFTQRDLAERAGLTEPTVHTALAKLERQGLIVRRSLSGNRRKQHTFLTERGHALRHVLEPLAIDANERALRGVEEAERSAFRDLLLRVLENLAEDELEAEARGLKVPPTRGLVDS